MYHLISQFKEEGEYPALKRSGRKPQPIDEITAELILETYRNNNVGPTHPEMKIEEKYGIHIQHSRVDRVLLNHGLVEIHMKKRQQRKYVRYERAHSMSMWQGDGKEFDERVRTGWIKEMAYRIHGRFIPFNHLPRDI